MPNSSRYRNDNDNKQNFQVDKAPSESFVAPVPQKNSFGKETSKNFTASDDKSPLFK